MRGGVDMRDQATRLYNVLCGSTSTAKRRSPVALTAAAAARAAAASAARSRDDSQTCQRMRPRNIASGASAGPAHGDGGAARPPGRLGGRRRGGAGARAVARVDAQRDHARERRVAGLLARRQLLAREALVVVRRGGGDRRVLRVVGLDDDAARAIAAPRPPRHLLEQLERPLGGAEVGQVHRLIGLQHADQRHAREVVALGHHLRARPGCRSRRRACAPGSRPARCRPPPARRRCRDPAARRARRGSARARSPRRARCRCPSARGASTSTTGSARARAAMRPQ